MPRHVDVSRGFYLIFPKRAAWGGEGGCCQTFSFIILLFFAVQQITSGIGHHIKYFLGLATNTLNVRNNDNNNSHY